MDSARGWLHKFQSSTKKKKSGVSEDDEKKEATPLTEEEVSEIIKKRVAAAKQYIENHYKEQMKNLQERGQIIKATGVVAKTAWVGAAYNLVLYMLASHVLGASWYLLSIERHATCWKSACRGEQNPVRCFPRFLDFRTFDDDDRRTWSNSTIAFNKCEPGYTEYFKNEFYSQAWDFFSDAYVELNSFVVGSGVDGVITDFPGTANKYRRNRCLTLGKDTPRNMTPVGPGSLLTVSETQPPAIAPSPVLEVSDVTEPPLPSVVAKPDSDNGTGDGATATPPKQPSGQAKVVVGIFLSNIAIILATVLLI